MAPNLGEKSSDSGRLKKRPLTKLSSPVAVNVCGEGAVGLLGYRCGGLRKWMVSKQSPQRKSSVSTNCQNSPTLYSLKGTSYFLRFGFWCDKIQKCPCNVHVKRKISENMWKYQELSLFFFHAWALERKWCIPDEVPGAGSGAFVTRLTGLRGLATSYPARDKGTYWTTHALRTPKALGQIWEKLWFFSSGKSNSFCIAYCSSSQISITGISQT